MGEFSPSVLHVTPFHLYVTQTRLLYTILIIICYIPSWDVECYSIVQSSQISEAKDS